MSKVKFILSSESNLIDSKGTITQDGFNSFKLVPSTVGSSFESKFNTLYDTKSSDVYDNLNILNLEAETIKNDILALSNNLTVNYLSVADLTSASNIGNITSAIAESTATFVTAEQAGQWYGLQLTTDINNKKYITGFDVGAITSPLTNNTDSYFRINADRFIVGSDLGDGAFSSMVDENGEPIPAFSIIQDENSIPKMYFNGKVNINGIPQQVNKYIGSFSSSLSLELFLSNNTDTVLSAGDTYLNTTEKVVYMWNGTTWTSTEARLEKFVTVFYRSNTKPTAPIGGDYFNLPAGGWSDGIPAPSSTIQAKQPIWVSYASIDNKTDYAVTPVVWSDPFIVMDTPTSDYMYNSTTNVPTNPTNTTDSTDVSSADSANGWYNLARADSVWVAVRYKNEGLWSSWQVIRIKGEIGEPGTPGTPGTNGSRGPGVGFYSYSSSSTSDYQRTQAFYSATGLYSLVVGDYLVWTNTSKDTGGTSGWKWGGSSWINYTGLEIHGDAIIEGTLVASNVFSNGLIAGCAGSFDTTRGYVYNSYGGYGETWALLAKGSSSHNGIAGLGNKYGVAGECNSSSGVSVFGWGATYNSIGVRGHSSNKYGVYGSSDSNYGVYGTSGSAYAGYFAGKAYVDNFLQVGSWVGVTGSLTTASNLVVGVNATVTGKVTAGSLWVGSTQVAFTGGHIVLSKNEILIGDIVYTDKVHPVNISQTFPEVLVTDVDKDKRVIGIISFLEDAEDAMSALTKIVKVNAYDTEEPVIKDYNDEDIINTTSNVSSEFTFIDKANEDVYNYTIDNKLKVYKTNSIGEGLINVCAIGGDIDNGDYICSSTVRGKGMKQEDDLMHNYTVAKALEIVIWDDEVIGENRCFEQDGYKCKMISCTYHCG